MSSIGPAGYATQIASSLARTHRADADSARLREGGRQQTVEAARTGVEAVEDAAKAELSTDRDPDGRRSWEFNAPAEDADSEPSNEDRRPKITDTLDAIGGHLDLEA